MFIVDKLRELLRVRLLKDIEAGGFVRDGLADSVDQSVRSLRAKGVDQHFTSVVDAALHDVLLRDDHLIELFQDRFSLGGAEMSQLRHSVGDALNLILRKVFKDLGACGLSER